MSSLLQSRTVGDGWTSAALELREQTVVLQTSSETFEAPYAEHPNGDPDGAATLADVGCLAAAVGIELRGCLNCLHFRSSGMSAQFSGGFEAYCNLAGFRNPDAIVRADFACGEHTLVPGWPDDLDASFAARRAAALAPRLPSRISAFQGALLGQAAGGPATPGGLAAISKALTYWRRSEKVLEALRSNSSDERGTALLVVFALQKRSPEQMWDRLASKHGLGSEFLASALDCFSQSPLDVLQVVRAAGSGNIARIAGAVAGAFNGIDSIPAGQRDVIADVQELLNLAERLHEASLALEMRPE